MAKEDILKKVELRVTINCCEGCKRKVLKALSINGIMKTEIHPTLPKVTVIGNVDSSTLIKKLAKAGKAAELWQTEKANPTPTKPDQDAEKAQGIGKEMGKGSSRAKESSTSINSPNDEISLVKGDGDRVSKKIADEKDIGDCTGGNPVSEITAHTAKHTAAMAAIPQVGYVINPSMVQGTASYGTASGAQVCYPAAQPCTVPITCYASSAYSVPPPCCVHHRLHYELPMYNLPPPPIQPLAPQFADYFNDENTVGCSVM